MSDLESIVKHAQVGDIVAFATLVRRFQDMAVGYGYSILGDFHLAQDAAQEAFLEAYVKLAAVAGDGGVCWVVAADCV